MNPKPIVALLAAVTIAVGGVLLVLAGATAVATVVVGLLRLARLR